MSIADLPRAEPRAQATDVDPTSSVGIGQSTAVAGVIGVLVCTALVITAADRSVALSDEALYLLLVDNPEASIRSGTGFHVLLNPLFEAVGKSLPEWRLVRAVFDIGADLAFGLALLSYLRERSPNAIFASRAHGVALVTAVTLIGFLSWSWSVNGFGYNETGAVLITLVAALFLQSIKSPNRIDKAAVFSALGVGAMLVGQFMTRWTAGTATLLGIIVVTSMYTTGRKGAVLLAAAMSGAATFALVVHAFILDIPTVVGGIAAGTRDVSQGTHSIEFILGQYVRSVRLGIEFGIVVILALFVAGAAVHFRRTTQSNSILVGLLFGFAVFLLTFGQRVLFGGPRSETVNGFAAALVGLALASLLARSVRSVPTMGLVASVQTSLLPALLLLLPFGASFGTNVLILLVALFSSPLWVGAIVISEQRANFQGRIGTVVAVGLMLLAAGVPILTYQSLHTQGPWALGEQDVLVERGRFAGLYVDQVSHDLLVDVEELRLGLDPEPTVISLWSRPGITYGLGGSGIGFPWYASRARDAAAATITGACTEDGFVASEQIVIVHEVGRADLDPVDDALTSCGINFPADFTLVETLAAPGGVELRVYVDDRSN